MRYAEEVNVVISEMNDKFEIFENTNGVIRYLQIATIVWFP